VRINNADQNILFGLLALQTGLLGEEQVFEGLRECSSGTCGFLSDALHDRMHLTDEAKQLLDGLYRTLDLKQATL